MKVLDSSDQKFTLQASNPYADFERIFNHFATAEELTGPKREDESKAQNGDDSDMAAPPSPVVSLPANLHLAEIP